MTRFEYRFELGVREALSNADDRDRLQESMNQLGGEGWELVAVSPCDKENLYLGYWFKREIESK